MSTVKLDHRYADQGVRAFVTHPPGSSSGPAPSPRRRWLCTRAHGLADEDGDPIINPQAGKKSVEQVAATLVFGAASPLLNGLGGVYLEDCDNAVLDATPDL